MQCNNSMQVFTFGGQYLRQFGEYGEDNGELNCPSSISIDSDDVVYVTEYYKLTIMFQCSHARVSF